VGIFSHFDLHHQDHPQASLMPFLYNQHEEQTSLLYFFLASLTLPVVSGKFGVFPVSATPITDKPVVFLVESDINQKVFISH
jgi:hypothetical protein